MWFKIVVKRLYEKREILVILGFYEIKVNIVKFVMYFNIFVYDLMLRINFFYIFVVLIYCIYIILLVGFEDFLKRYFFVDRFLI